MPILGSQEAGQGSIPTAAGADSPGAGVAGTLAAIYTAGLADPSDDNLFPMASGNLRFWGDVDATSFPASAFFESASTPGDSRVAVDFIRRYYETSLAVGGFTAREIAGYDPAWDGTFGGMGGLQVTSETISFGSTDNQSSLDLSRLVVGKTIWHEISGFFDGPGTFPLPGSGGDNPGSREDFEINLYNASDAALARRHALTGWGQYYSYPRPVDHGITVAHAAIPSWSFSTAAGDGVAWYAYNSDPGGANPVGGLSVQMTTASKTGPWGVGLWAYDGTTFKELAQIDWAGGAVFKVPVSDSGWFSHAAAFLFGKNAALTECTPFKAGLQTESISNGLFSDANVEGGAYTPTSTTTPAPLSDAFVWENPSASPFGVYFRARFTAAPSGQVCDFGLSGTSVDVTILASSAIDATHWILNMDSGGNTTVQLSVADTLWHDFAIVYLPGGTVAAYVDDVLVGSTTTLTHLPGVKCRPAVFQQGAGQIQFSKAAWAYAPA